MPSRTARAIARSRSRRARSRSVELPRGSWIDFWTRERVEGGQRVEADAPLGRIPVWVRAGSILPTYPAAEVARGLPHAPARERTVEAELWGLPPLGRALVKLADGGRIAWRAGRWSSSGTELQVRYEVDGRREDAGAEDV